MEDVINWLKDSIYKRHGIRTDAHYTEGVGVLFVAEGFEVDLRNTISAYSEKEMMLLQVFIGV